MICAICGEPISQEDRRYRHNGLFDGQLEDMHEKCCLTSGPCHDRVDPFNLHQQEG